MDACPPPSPFCSSLEFTLLSPLPSLIRVHREKNIIDSGRVPGATRPPPWIRPTSRREKGRRRGRVRHGRNCANQVFEKKSRDFLGPRVFSNPVAACPSIPWPVSVDIVVTDNVTGYGVFLLPSTGPPYYTANLSIGYREIPRISFPIFVELRIRITYLEQKKKIPLVLASNVKDKT